MTPHNIIIKIILLIVKLSKKPVNHCKALVEVSIISLWIFEELRPLCKDPCFFWHPVDHKWNIYDQGMILHGNGE